MEQPPFELLPVLAADASLEVKQLDPLGFQTLGRMNFLYPPFDNVKIRRAAFLALNQKDVLDALVGDPAYYRICGAIFGCGTPMATEEGADSLTKGNGLEEAKRLLAESGYDGTPIALMAATDVVSLKAQPIVAAELLRKAGFKVDVQASDWQTIVTRRASQKSPKDGGWNMFFTNWVGADILNPVAHVTLNGKGRNGGWFGWPEDSKMEELRDAYARAGSLGEQKKIAAEVQARAFEQVTYIPLGQFKSPSVWRKTIKGVLPGASVPVFWNVEKSD
jgi:peptide/nickel transport system substrate-binding protein